MNSIAQAQQEPFWLRPRLSWYCPSYCHMRTFVFHPSPPPPEDIPGAEPGPSEGPLWCHPQPLNPPMQVENPPLSLVPRVLGGKEGNLFGARLLPALLSTGGGLGGSGTGGLAAPQASLSRGTRSKGALWGWGQQEAGGTGLVAVPWGAPSVL